MSEGKVGSPGGVEMVESVVAQKGASNSAPDFLARGQSRAAKHMTTSLEACAPVMLEWSNIDLVVQVPENPGARRVPCVPQKTVDKAILRGISGRVFPGEMVAIMGASGAGKTSLLNVLARRTTKNTGRVLVNGEPATTAMYRLGSFVQQEDLFIGTLTVREHLRFIAMLRMDQSLSQAEVDAHVDGLLDALSLTKVAHSKIGSVSSGLTRGISGGERKRLAIASEIIMDPSLLFADEPTSGLDSHLCRSVVEALSVLAANGRTILTTIHQPSSEVFSLFDKLMLLAEGRLVYFGPREEAVTYFSALGPDYTCPPQWSASDFLISALAHARDVPGEIDRLAAVWDASAAANAMAARLPPAPTTDVFRKAIEDAARDAGAATHKGASDVESGGASGASGGAHQQPLRYGSVVFRPVGEIVKDSGGLFVASFFKQFTVLLQRSFLATLRNPLSTYVRIIQTIVLGLIAGFIFYDVGNGQKAIQNLQGLVFFTIINQSLSSIFATLQTFPLERPVLLREHEAGAYRIDAFYFARTLSDVPFQIIFPTAFVAIIWALAGVSDDADRFGLFLAVLLLASNGGFSLGFLLSAVAPSVEVALGLAPLVLLPFMLTAGLFVNVDSLGPGIEWVAHISFMKYGFAGACTAIFKGRKFECDVPPFQPCFSEGDQVLRALSVDADDDDFTMNLVALSIIIVAFRLIGLFALQLSARRRQNA